MFVNENHDNTTNLMQMNIKFILETHDYLPLKGNYIQSKFSPLFILFILFFYLFYNIYLAYFLYIF